MLNIEGISNIGDITKNNRDQLNTSLMTFNTYKAEGVEVNKAEFWQATLVGNAKDAFKECKKGESINFKGFLKNWYNEQLKTTYYNLIIYDGEVVAAQEKKNLKISVKGKGKIGEIQTENGKNKTSLLTYEKITPSNGAEEKYNNMFWNLELSNNAYVSLKKCEKGNVIEIKKALLHNNYSENAGKTFAHISVFSACKVVQTENLTKDDIQAQKENNLSVNNEPENMKDKAKSIHR